MKKLIFGLMLLVINSCLADGIIIPPIPLPVSVLNGGTGTTTSTGSGSTVLSSNPNLTAPNIGAASGTSLNVTGLITTSAGNITTTKSGGFFQQADGTSTSYFGSGASLVSGAGASDSAVRGDGTNLVFAIGSVKVGAFSTSALTLQGSIIASATGATGVGDTFLCFKSDGTFRQGATCAASTARIKDSIKPLKSGLSLVNKMEPVTFIYNAKAGKDKAGKKAIGLIAEKSARLDSRLAVFEKDGKTPLSVDDRAYIAVLVKAVQELSAEVEKLKAIK